MFGNLKAKIGGLKHVYVYYIKGAPETLALYEPTTIVSACTAMRMRGRTKNPARMRK